LIKVKLILRAHSRFLLDLANSFSTFSNSVVETPLAVSSLSLFAISKDRFASSIAKSVREKTLAETPVNSSETKIEL